MYFKFLDDSSRNRKVYHSSSSF